MKGLIVITMFSLATGIFAAPAGSPLAVKPSSATGAAAAPVKQDSLIETKRKAEAGDVKAQIAFGEEFARMQKFTQAERWYSEAAAKGEPAALFALADLYSASRGSGTNAIKANTTNALVLHKLAAAQGFKKSDMQLGIAYKDGIGARKDVVRAFTHFKLADASPSREVLINQLVAEMTQAQIDEAEKIVAAFKPASFQTAFAELVFDSVRITGIFGGAQNRVAMVNGKQVNPGQQMNVNIAGINAQVKLDEIAADGVFVSFGALERKIKPQRL